MKRMDTQTINHSRVIVVAVIAVIVVIRIKKIREQQPYKVAAFKQLLFSLTADMKTILKRQGLGKGTTKLQKGVI